MNNSDLVKEKPAVKVNVEDIVKMQECLERARHPNVQYQEDMDAMRREAAKKTSDALANLAQMLVQVKIGRTIDWA